MFNDLRIFMIICKREILIAQRNKSDWLGVILFYLIVVCLFPIALGRWSNEQLNLLPIILWIGALLACVLAQDNLLRNDYQLGVIEQMLMSPYGLYAQMLAKIFAHWLLFGLPLVLCTPLLAVCLGANLLVVCTLTFSLLFGTLILSLISAIGAALTVSLARGGLLLAVIILPLLVPILVLGVSMGILSTQGVFNLGHYALLLAVLIGSILGAPWLVGMAVRESST